MNLSHELDIALKAARKAGEYVMSEYRTFKPIPNAPASISTHVDHEAQEIILRKLRLSFADDGLLAEERTPTLQGVRSDIERTWVVDPIDGTRGFAMKNGEFSVMIGMTFAGKPVLGVVYEPVIDRMTYAVAGGGCHFMTGGEPAKRCFVTEISSFAESTIVLSHLKTDKPSRILDSLKPKRVLQTYSAGIKLAMVARGDADIYVNDYPNFHDWDICAGQILVEEAAGRVTELGGKPIHYGSATPVQRDGMIASNGRLHDNAVKSLKTGSKSS